MAKKKDEAKKNKEMTEFDFEGKKYRVRRPSNKVRRESEAIHARAYRDAITDNYLLDAEIDDILEARGYSPKATNKKKDSMVKKIRSLEVKLCDGDYDDIAEGKEIAFEVIDLRNEILNIDAVRSQLEAQSVDRIAENKRFNYYAYACCTDDKDNKIWGDFEEFENDDSPLAIKAATELLLLVYGINQDARKDIDSNRVENRWLKKHGFMNEDLQLIDQDGRPVDREGRLINEKGEYVDEEGNRVDIYGNRLNEDGELMFKEEWEALEKAKKGDEVPEKKEPVAAG